MITNIHYWVWLADLLPPPVAWRVLQHFGSPEKAFHAQREALDAVPKLSTAHRALLEHKDLTAAKDIVRRCDKAGIRVAAFSDSEYPDRLRAAKCPPLVLYLRGRVLRYDDHAVIAMVGTRDNSAYGLRIARVFAAGILAYGGILATGVTKGCDAIAAQAGVRFGGPVVLVVPCGVDTPYYNTPECIRLMEQAAETGCILSDCPPGTQPAAGHFKRRNEILIGMSCGVFCTEGNENSGAVKVAMAAGEQGKDIYVCPANLDAPSFAGTNLLLSAHSAIGVDNPRKMMTRYPGLTLRHMLSPAAFRQEESAPAPRKPKRKARTPEPSPEMEKAAAGEKGVDTHSNTGYIEILNGSHKWTDKERELVALLADGPVQVDTLIDRTGLSAREIGVVLVMLVVDDIIEEIPGGRYQLTKRSQPGKQ